MKKSLNLIWLKGFLYKLAVLDTRIKNVKIIESFLTDRIFQTKIEDFFCTIKHILVGVQQGSYLSPIFIQPMSTTRLI